MARSVESPCIDVCRFDAKSGWCEGCGRTLEEARQWRKLTPFRRRQVAAELPRRMARLQAGQGAGLVITDAGVEPG